MGDDARQRWQQRYDAALAAGKVRDADFTTLSGVEVDPVYGPADESAVPGFERIGYPGEFPFTRGLHATGYRGRAWTIRQFAGFGNAQQTNERYRMILAEGGGGLSVAFDMPTLMGLDSDDPRSLGEVGHCGVAIDTAADMDVLFDEIPLGDTTTSMTISGPAVPVFCMYLVAAERQGVDLGVLNGTLQTDIFKEYIAQKEWLFAPEPHLRLIGDLMEYCAENIPAYKPICVSGYHIREAGSTAAQELAYTLADGFAYVELGLSRGLDIEQFAPGLSFFFDAHLDFFEEIAKFRAARRIWARWLRDVYGAKTEKAQQLRFHTQTAGVSLTAQQPDNNITRTAVEALSAILGGTQSLHTNALDEVLALPSAKAAQIALRTQQVIMEETGVINVADPLGGSWYVEALTDDIERQAEEIFARIKDMSSDGTMTAGILRGIEDGWFTGEIAEAAFVYQRALEKGDKKVVGVNTLTGSVDAHDTLDILRVSHQVEIDQKAELTARRQNRDDDAARAAVHGWSRWPDRGEHDPGDARRRPRRGDPGRDLRRPACRVGRLHGARQILRPAVRAPRSTADPRVPSRPRVRRPGGIMSPMQPLVPDAPTRGRRPSRPRWPPRWPAPSTSPPEGPLRGRRPGTVRAAAERGRPGRRGGLGRRRRHRGDLPGRGARPLVPGAGRPRLLGRVVRAVQAALPGARAPRRGGRRLVGAGQGRRRRQPDAGAGAARAGHPRGEGGVAGPARGRVQRRHPRGAGPAVRHRAGERDHRGSGAGRGTRGRPTSPRTPAWTRPRRHWSAVTCRGRGGLPGDPRRRARSPRGRPRAPAGAAVPPGRGGRSRRAGAGRRRARRRGRPDPRGGLPARHRQRGGGLRPAARRRPALGG